MPDLVTSNSFDNVRQLEQSDSNAAATFNTSNQQLANRTAFLRQRVDSLTAQLATAQGQVTALANIINGLVIGGTVQGYSPILQEIAGLSKVASRVLGTDASGNFTYLPFSNILQGVEFIDFEERFNSGTNAGAGVANQWIKRNLNTVLANQGNRATLGTGQNAGQITLQAGRYRCYGFASAAGVDGFTTRLRNTTDGSTLVIGSSGNAIKGAGALQDTINLLSVMRGGFTLSAQKVLEFQCTSQQLHSTAAVSWGIAAGRGQSEVYAGLYLERFGNA